MPQHHKGQTDEVLQQAVSAYMAALSLKPLLEWPLLSLAICFHVTSKTKTLFAQFQSLDC